MVGAKIDKLLQGMTVIVDTREHQTPNAIARQRRFGVPFVRKKLDFGDYSAFFKFGDEEFSLENKIVIERKCCIDEIAMCYTSQRKRFKAEFERAYNAGAKTYLLIEDASWEKFYSGVYQSKMTPQALVASLTTWLARYNCQIIFCQARTTPLLIVEILKREAKEILLSKGETHGATT